MNTILKKIQNLHFVWDAHRWRGTWSSHIWQSWSEPQSWGRPHWSSQLFSLSHSPSYGTQILTTDFRNHRFETGLERYRHVKANQRLTWVSCSWARRGNRRALGFSSHWSSQGCSAPPAPASQYHWFGPKSFHNCHLHLLEPSSVYKLINLPLSRPVQQGKSWI